MALTLTVGTNTYISQANATIYFEGALHAASWTSASSTTKDQSLVTAARMLDRQSWQGSKTEYDQAMEWPRLGVTDKYGDEIDEDTVPQQVIDAQCELALSLIQSLKVQTNTNSTNNTKRLKAGSVEIEYFRQVKGGRFPTIVGELINQFLGSTSSSTQGSYATGTDECSTADDDYDVNSGYA